jgi:hypothetical protein
MGIMEALHWPLVGVALGGLLVGLMPLVWLLRRFGRALTGRPQPPATGASYFAMLLLTVLLIGAGVAALGLSAALATYHSFTKKRHAAEVQAIDLGAHKLRVYLVPIEADGTRGATETYDLDGDEWTVGGDVLRMRPFLTVLGLETVYKVSRVEGRWLKAEDANTHKGTAYDREGGTGQGWLQLYKNGASGPFRWLIAGAHGQAVSQLPDRRAVFDLYVTPNGFVVDKRSL